MIPSLAETVQNRKHIIQEDNDQSWVRGGIPTREMVRNMDYIKNCNLNNYRDLFDVAMLFPLF